MVELCSTLGAFIVLLMRMGVPGSVTRFYFDFEHDKDQVRNYITTVYYFLMAASVIIAGGVGVVFWFWGEALTPGLLFYPFIVLVLLNNFFSTNADLQKRLLQAREQSRYMAVLNVIVSFISIGLTLLFVVYYGLGAIGMVMAQVITSFVFFIQAQFYLRSDLGGVFNIGYLKSSVRYGAGLLPHHLFAAFAPLLAKVLLAGTHSLTALGVYALALKLTLPLDVLYNSFNQGFQPVYFKTRKQIEAGEVSKKELIVLFQKILLIAVGIYSALVLLSPWFIIRFIPDRFHESIPLIPIIGIGFLGQVMYMLQVSDLFYSKRTSVIPLITGAGMVVNITVAYFLVKQFGAIGVGWASTLGFITWALVSFILSNKLHLYFSTRSYFSLLIPVVIYHINFHIAYENLILRTLVILVIITFLYLLFRSKSN